MHTLNFWRRFLLLLDGEPAPGMSGGDAAHVDGGAPNTTETPPEHDQDDDNAPLDSLVLDSEDDEPGAIDPATNRPRPLEESVKKLVAKNRKLRRALMRRAGPAERLKGVDVDATLYKARSYDELMAAVNTGDQSVILRALGIKAPAGDAPPKRAATVDLEDAEFDDSPDTIGFDAKETKANEFIANLGREIARLKKAYGTLKGEHVQQRQQTAQQELDSHKQSWTVGTTEALAKIANPARKAAFVDLIKGAWSRGDWKKVSVQKVIDTYLPAFVDASPAPNAAAIKAAADKKAAADLAARTGTRGQVPNGRPAGVDGNRPGPRLADIKKKIASMG